MFNICFIRLEQGVVKWRKMWWKWSTLIPEPPRLDHWSSGTGKVCIVLVLLPGSRIGLRSLASRFTGFHHDHQGFTLNETWWNRYTMSNMYMSHSTLNNTSIYIYTYNIHTYYCIYKNILRQFQKASKPTECDSNLLQTTFPPMLSQRLRARRSLPWYAIRAPAGSGLRTAFRIGWRSSGDGKMGWFDLNKWGW